MYDWNGFYAGVNAGYGGDEFKYPVDGNLTAGSTTETFDAEASLTSGGFVGGVQLGYNQFFSNNWLIGLETDIDLSGIKGDLSANGALSGTVSGTAGISAGSKIDYLGTVRARIGYVTDQNLLVYVTGGLVYGDVKSHYDIAVSSGSSTLFSASGSKSSTDTGWTLGAGGEIPIDDQITLRGEYLYADLGDHALLHTPFSVLGATGTININAKTTVHIVRLGLDIALD